MAGLLIIDDEMESRDEIRSIVVGSQYNYLPIYECGTAQKGLGLVKDYQPNMVILDLSLPDMEGIECGKRIREYSPLIPVVVITQLQMFELVQAAINAGFSGFLLKPVSKTELVATLDRLLMPQLLKETQAVRNVGSAKDTCEIDFGNPIQSAVQYIHSNFHEQITLNDVADRVYLSGSHFSRLFKAEMKVTFIEYLTRYRVEQAKRLLKMTSLPIEVIANNAGFTNAGYFATTFKRLENVTPSEYRQMFSSLLLKNDNEQKY
ncbi:helix-turn-helix domain-containing protein [Brevibacillus agri]|uniref:response regulator transcription factor n=1 Tax=Brevibacillus agri TaxID=51101 RepID=UPI002E235F0C|nr:helix-turn-helix domain-containing protein [Brevibacillus agri]MED1644429.1 helix-turn-helix domain-containing protein [Brevibacillus agri]MED1657205.1 helix-turn-helix domain-containing protein [Brevibacillus agri]MED1689630.1 helix-turn-helix domain-containing protein [Brevibacillus agri]MED1693916.1 helix-turn-helix domain-containing protein [Brevibacillus agri]MED1698292.1 helix-turn-helix domain-containing protein [Brevibacillus agri]